MKGSCCEIVPDIWINCDLTYFYHPSLVIPPATQELQETWLWSLGWEDPLEEEMAAHSSVLAWRLPWTEEPGELQSMGSQRVIHNWSNLARIHFYNTFPSYFGAEYSATILLIRPQICNIIFYNRVEASFLSCGWSNFGFFVHNFEKLLSALSVIYSLILVKF